MCTVLEAAGVDIKVLELCECLAQKPDRSIALALHGIDSMEESALPTVSAAVNDSLGSMLLIVMPV